MLGRENAQTLIFFFVWIMQFKKLNVELEEACWWRLRTTNFAALRKRVKIRHLERDEQYLFATKRILEVCTPKNAFTDTPFLTAEPVKLREPIDPIFVFVPIVYRVNISVHTKP